MNLWIPAFAGMTVVHWIPAFAGMMVVQRSLPYRGTWQALRGYIEVRAYGALSRSLNSYGLGVPSVVNVCLLIPHRE